jgi:hypothetical protein
MRCAITRTTTDIARTRQGQSPIKNLPKNLLILLGQALDDGIILWS